MKGRDKGGNPRHQGRRGRWGFHRNSYERNNKFIRMKRVMGEGTAASKVGVRALGVSVKKDPEGSSAISSR